MRYIKVPGITIRIPLLSITSADYILTRWKDPEKAFERAANLIGAKLERLSDWGQKEVKGHIIKYIKIKIVDFWEPFVGPLEEQRDDDVLSSS